MARVPEAVTRPRVSWHMSSSIPTPLPSFYSSTPTPLPSFSSSSPSSSKLNPVTEAQSISAKGGVDRAQEGGAIFEEEGNEDLLFGYVSGNGNESDVMRAEILFDIVQNLL